MTEASIHLKAKQDIRLQMLSKRLIKGACHRINISNSKKGYQYSKYNAYKKADKRSMSQN